MRYLFEQGMRIQLMHTISLNIIYYPNKFILYSLRPKKIEHIYHFWPFTKNRVHGKFSINNDPTHHSTNSLTFTPSLLLFLLFSYFINSKLKLVSYTNCSNFFWMEGVLNMKWREYKINKVVNF